MLQQSSSNEQAPRLVGRREILISGVGFLAMTAAAGCRKAIESTRWNSEQLTRGMQFLSPLVSRLGETIASTIQRGDTVPQPKELLHSLFNAEAALHLAGDLSGRRIGFRKVDTEIGRVWFLQPHTAFTEGERSYLGTSIPDDRDHAVALDISNVARFQNLFPVFENNEDRENSEKFSHLSRGSFNFIQESLLHLQRALTSGQNGDPSFQCSAVEASIRATLSTRLRVLAERIQSGAFLADKSVLNFRHKTGSTSTIIGRSEHYAEALSEIRMLIEQRQKQD